MRSSIPESEIYNIENNMDKFLNNFNLDRNSIFHDLIISIIKLKKSRKDKCSFSLKEYDFWLKNSSRKLDSVPKNWESIQKSITCNLYELMFSLETGYALFGKMLLSKIAEDQSFPGISLTDLIKDFEGILFKGISDFNISTKIIKRTSDFFVQMRNILYEPIFEEDIFLWWSQEIFLSQTSSIAIIEFTNCLLLLITKLRQCSFENMLSSYDIKTNKNLDNNRDILSYFYQNYFDASIRKALGEFYTSTEVVEFITDQLDYTIDNIKENSRFIDLACGSGSFIDLAFERYIHNVLNKKNCKNINWASILNDICTKPLIVGLDINPFAVLLSQLRVMIRVMEFYKKAKESDPLFHLRRLPIFRTDSLHIEKELSKTMKNSDTKKNQISVQYEYPIKDKKGNFIIGEITIPQFEILKKTNFISSVEDYYSSFQALFDTIKRILRNELFLIKWKKEDIITELQVDLKYYLKKNISEIPSSYVDLFNTIIKLVTNVKSNYGNDRIVKLLEDSVLAIIAKNYLKFTYVAGNPPYVDFRKQNKNNNYYQLLYADLATGQPDYYVYFLKRGIDILTEDGKLCYILSDQWLYTGYGQQLRKYLFEKIKSNDLKLKKWIDFRDQMLFSDAVNLTAIGLFEKHNKNETIKIVRVFDIKSSKNYLQEISNSLQTLVESKTESFTTNDSLGFDYFLYKYQNLEEEIPWSFKPLEEQNLYVKIKNQCSDTFGSLFDIHTGTQTSADKLYKVEIVSEDINNSIVKVRNRKKEIFLIERTLLKHVVREKVPISKWIIRNESWLIFPYLTQKNAKEEEYSHIIDIDEMRQNFQHAYSYFTSHETILKKRENIKATEKNFYKYAYEKNHLSLERIKLIPQSLGNTMAFALDFNGSIYLTDAAGRASHILKRDPLLDNYKLLLALFNSKSYDFFSKNYAAPYGGGSFQFNEAFSKNIPVPFESLIKWHKKKDIIVLVNEIIENLSLKARLDKFPKGFIPSTSNLVEYQIQTSKLRKISDLKLHISNYSLIYKDGKEIKQVATNSALQVELLLKIVEFSQSIDGTQIFSIPLNDKDIQNAFDLYKTEEKNYKTLRKVEIIEKDIEKLINEFLHLDEKDLQVIDKFHSKFTNKINRGV